jgi:hypothetical protein
MKFKADMKLKDSPISHHLTKLKQKALNVIIASTETSYSYYFKTIHQPHIYGIFDTYGYVRDVFL